MSEAPPIGLPSFSLALTAEPNAEAIAEFRSMLAQGSSGSIVDNDELGHIPLKQLMKKKDNEMIDALRCQWPGISMTGIKLGKNGKKFFSILFTTRHSF